MTEKIKKEPEDMAVYKVGEKIPADEILRQLCLTDLNRYREDAGKSTIFEASMRRNTRKSTPLKPIIATTKKYNTLIGQTSKPIRYLNRAEIKDKKFREPIIRRGRGKGKIRKEAKYYG